MGVRVDKNLSYINNHSEETLFGNPVHISEISEEIFKTGLSIFEKFCEDNDYEGLISESYDPILGSRVLFRIEKEDNPNAVVLYMIPGNMSNENGIMERMLQGMKDNMDIKINEREKDYD